MKIKTQIKHKNHAHERKSQFWKKNKQTTQKQIPQINKQVIQTHTINIK